MAEDDSEPVSDGDNDPAAEPLLDGQPIFNSEDPDSSGGEGEGDTTEEG